jgi:homogentisate 1,2-dioxygenase
MFLIISTNVNSNLATFMGESMSVILQVLFSKLMNGFQRIFVSESTLKSFSWEYNFGPLQFNLSFFHAVQTGSGDHPASYRMGTRGSLTGVKAAGA